MSTGKVFYYFYNMRLSKNIFPALCLAVATSASLATAAEPVYSPFQKDAYLTSSFGENRGTRYHAGVDYSTLMEEGWVIYAPEDGKVEEVRVSPFFYGKVMFYKGESGKTWVFAHQSSFGKLDSLVFAEQYSKKSNDVILKPGVSYKKGDTLTFSGSTGIGNPHLHLEIRQGKNNVISPCGIGVYCGDTLDPQIFGMAVWQKDDLSVTSPEALDKGCVEYPGWKKEKAYLAVKIADYSRHPKENPMSIRRLTLWDGKKKVYNKVQDTLSYGNMLKIRTELLWAEEADTAGDWHFVDAALKAGSKYRIEVEDMVGRKVTRDFTFQDSCAGNSPIPQMQVQEAPVYSFLSRSMLNLTLCDKGGAFSVLDDSQKILEEDLCKVFPHKGITLGSIIDKHSKARFIKHSGGLIAMHPVHKDEKTVRWETSLDSMAISQKVTKLRGSFGNETQVLAVTRTHTDSLDFYEFHPKGLHFTGTWEVCLDPGKESAPLYWLGETSRRWFIFSKQEGTGKRCAQMNELRDLANILNKNAPTLGTPYWGKSFIMGKEQDVLRIPTLFRYDGFENGNSIVTTVNGNWIATEYDSEPREIVLEGSRLKKGDKLHIQLEDEAHNKAEYDVVVPKKEK
ncbi:MAG: M23 family metallopeptidase [Fibrobacter sp.]|nr:M23 family metallopeptidase [Fibrobacter sp.]